MKLAKMVGVACVLAGASAGAAVRRWRTPVGSRWLAAVLFVLFASTSQAAVQLSGTYGYVIDPATRTVRLNAERIENTSSVYTTGTLRLELWASRTPYIGGGITGYRIGVLPINSTTNGTLSPNYFYSNTTGVTPITNWPPDGSYYMTMMVSEYSPGACVSADFYCIVDYGNFSNLMTVRGGNAVTGVSVPVSNRPLEIVGSYGVNVDLTANTVNFLLDRIQNPATNHTTGTLRVELWATTSPYDGGDLNGYRVAAYQAAGSTNGTLAGGQYFSDINVTSPITNRPPAGSYYMTIVVAEYGTNCTTDDHFCINTFAALSNPLTVAPVAAPAPVTPTRICVKAKKGVCKKWK